MRDYQEALAYIHGRVKSHKDATMQRMQLLMTKLGHPERQINAIHVAGTNGKGSVVAFLRNMLQAAGLTVGTFTSPFLVRFNERISVNGIPISDAEIVRLVNLVAPIVAEIDAAMPNEGPTEFEVLTAMMFAYFAEGHADVVIVEVGIGGDNDSTNVVIPQLSVITTIGYDHMQFLGNTLESIAGHKAGIIKPNTPVVIGRIEDGPRAVIEQRAEQESAPLSALTIDFNVQAKPIAGWHEQFQFSDVDGQIKDVKLNMMGDFQIDNAAVAIEAFKQFMDQRRIPFDNAVIKQGLLSTQWAGRFEKLNDQPLVIIDGAHNMPAIKEIEKNIKNYFSDREIYIILAILADKQYLPMIEVLAQLNNVHLILTEFKGPIKRAAADLSATANSVASANQIEFIDNWKEAIVSVSNQMTQDDVLLITGSLYFISDVRALFMD
ncbi:folylpolyglutamate synthase/dihydrofolate synthase family protein [Lactobacillus sp. Sy-1]|uniref:bifunctional folylpolyglutamate synthase/dihydrofolate synthase n=1 Tax=Lactobacillus sp. Sy-1 TaxID=2109645 RepID=UPI001C58D42D|nr:folylpolyglutamate synthase/dihydrofolate synthase family protein [Lactobacillus sp. Sy-1]MBW1605809.1 bifunctional folylpolyglutamate synthase/dihydrofolate synthase [Lactobacillus sp. Sy-1]